MLDDPNLDALIVIFVPPGRRGCGRDRRDDPSDRRARRPQQAGRGRGRERRGHPRRAARAGLRRPALPYPESAARALALAVERSAPGSSAPPARPRRAAGIDLPAARAAGRVGPLVGTADAWLDPVPGSCPPSGLRRPGRPRAHGRGRGRGRGRRLRGSAFRQSCRPAAACCTRCLAGASRSTPATRVQVQQAAPASERLVAPALHGPDEPLAGNIVDNRALRAPSSRSDRRGVFAQLIGEGASRPRTADGRRRQGARHGAARPGGSPQAFAAQPPASIAALTDLVLRPSAGSPTTLPQVAELDLNPVLAGPDGCVAVDARVRVAAPSAARRRKGRQATSPCPSNAYDPHRVPHGAPAPLIPPR